MSFALFALVPLFLFCMVVPRKERFQGAVCWARSARQQERYYTTFSNPSRGFIDFLSKSLNLFFEAAFYTKATSNIGFFNLPTLRRYTPLKEQITPYDLKDNSADKGLSPPLSLLHPPIRARLPKDPLSVPPLMPHMS